MNQDTLDKMRHMRLFGMHRAFRSSLESPTHEQLTADEMTTLLIDSEWDERHNRSIERSTKNARFRYKSTVEQIDYDLSRNLDKNQIHRLAECSYIRENQAILITGPTGTGKSFLASALGHQACQLGFKVLYANTTRLFAQLKMAKADGSGMRELVKIEKQDLLILDDFGIQPLDASSRTALMEIIEDRHGKRATIITSQLPIKEWYEVIGETTIADAILDRVINNAQRIELKGESLRRKTVKKETEEN
ncbi:MAG: hypothetical protein RLZZ466_1234 [Bacteroidota bacterium]|jgi:DNA replication protein DnaC